MKIYVEMMKLNSDHDDRCLLCLAGLHLCRDYLVRHHVLRHHHHLVLVFASVIYGENGNRLVNLLLVHYDILHVFEKFVTCSSKPTAYTQISQKLTVSDVSATSIATWNVHDGASINIVSTLWILASSA